MLYKQSPRSRKTPVPTQRKVLLFYGLTMHTAVHIVSILDRCGICSCVLQRESVRLKLKNKKVSKELLQWWPSVQSGNPYAPTLIYHWHAHRERPARRSVPPAHLQRLPRATLQKVRAGCDQMKQNLSGCKDTLGTYGCAQGRQQHKLLVRWCFSLVMYIIVQSLRMQSLGNLSTYDF